LLASLSDDRVWFSILVAFVVGGLWLLLGTWATRRVGLLDRDAPLGETVAVGLGSGLLVFAACWGAVASGGRSAFTPIAATLVVAVILALRSPRSTEADRSGADARPRFSRFHAAIVAAFFVGTVGLAFGATMAPSPRDGVQPVEHRDQAFYSGLAASLNLNGTESIAYPSGFDSIPGFPSQNWFHWGELWLAAAMIRVFGIDPVLARHYVVLPLLLLAAASLTGTLVRRMAGTSSRPAFLFGAAAILLLSPLPVLPGSLSGWWAVGLLFGITQYGLAVISALLSLYIVAILDMRRSTPALRLFIGAVVASMLPAHLVVAVLAVVGAGGVFFVGGIAALLGRPRPPMTSGWWYSTVATVFAVALVTAIWGYLTGHGLSGVGISSTVTPFNHAWVDAVIAPVLAGGAFLATPFAWLVTRRGSPATASVFLGTVVLVVSGAIAWGARLADFDMFHVFFAGIAVFATPVTAVGVWTLVGYVRQKGGPRLATAVLVLCIVQLELGVVPALARMQQFGPGPYYQPIPLTILAAIKTLPADAKLAYSCRTDEEEAFWNPALVSVYAHTGRRVVPMCFESDVFSSMIGADPSIRGENPFFKWAPQRSLFLDELTNPPASSIAAFLRSNGINYVYADAAHPNSLVPEAVLIATQGGVVVLRNP
jgi:hypothetical protein